MLAVLLVSPTLHNITRGLPANTVQVKQCKGNPENQMHGWDELQQPHSGLEGRECSIQDTTGQGAYLSAVLVAGVAVLTFSRVMCSSKSRWRSSALLTCAGAEGHAQHYEPITTRRKLLESA